MPPGYSGSRARCPLGTCSARRDDALRTRTADTAELGGVGQGGLRHMVLLRSQGDLPPAGAFLGGGCLTAVHVQQQGQADAAQQGEKMCEVQSLSHFGVQSYEKKRIRRTGKQSLCSFSASGWSNSCGAKTGRVLAETVRTLSYCKFSQWRKRRKNVLFWASRRAADFNTACRVGQHSVLCWKILPVAWGEIPCRKMPKNAGKALVLPCVCGKTAL